MVECLRCQTVYWVSRYRYFRWTIKPLFYLFIYVFARSLVLSLCFPLDVTRSPLITCFWTVFLIYTYNTPTLLSMWNFGKIKRILSMISLSSFSFLPFSFQYTWVCSRQTVSWGQTVNHYSQNLLLSLETIFATVLRFFLRGRKIES